MQALGQAGILASLAFVPGSDPLGTVEQQAKAAGTTVPYHSHVQINISKGPNATTERAGPERGRPDAADAVSTLNSAHLRLIYLKFPVTSRTQAGKVVAAVAALRRAGAAERPGAGVPRRLPRQASYQPRVSSSWLGSSDCVEMPTIASPRPDETRASTSASM